MTEPQSMTELQKALDNAYSLITHIQVSGDDVERMAAAKEYLRQAWRLSEKTEQPEPGAEPAPGGDGA